MSEKQFYAQKLPWDEPNVGADSIESIVRFDPPAHIVDYYQPPTHVVRNEDDES